MIDRPTSRLLLIGWDAADWQMIHPLLDAGQMPVLDGLIREGVMANLATLQPPISPMLWNSIATGKTADKHGILGFTERDPHTGEGRPFSVLSRRTKAVWNIFQQALGWRCHVANWWAGHPAEPLDGVTVTPSFFNTERIGPDLWRVPSQSIHPAGLEAEFAPLRMGIDEVDEHLVLPFIPRAAEIDQRSDVRLERLARLLSDTCSQQAIATAVLEREPWQFAAVYSDALDHFSHGFMRYHPPRGPHIAPEDFEMYREVMTSAYRFHDLMLGRLLELAGPEATVVLCSDHGFQSGLMRPYDDPREPAGPTFWHRDFGVLVMKGPGIKRDERIYGANLLDIAPTLLTLAGLPVGRDMDGKPLLEALHNPAAPTPIPSWDDVPGRDGRHPPGTRWEMTDQDAESLVRQFAALGYIDEPTADRQKDGENSEIEGRYNLAQVHLSAGRWPDAIGLLEGLVAARAWETRYIHQLANAYLKGGWFRAAEELLAQAYPPESADSNIPLVVRLMRAKARLGRGDREGAAARLADMMPRMLRHPTLWVESGWLWFELGRLAEAEQCFRRAVELENDTAAAWQGLSSVHLRRRENGAAIDAALEAVQRLHHLPVAHLNLGIGLAREGQTSEALVALRRAVGMQPGLVAAHRWLAALHATRQPDSFLAGAHRNDAHRLSRERGAESAAVRSRAEEARALLELLPPAERARREHEARPSPPSIMRLDKTFVIVSGLPRSGTSLMMQMLQAGGLPARTDGERTADLDNPEGYLEWEAIKRVARQPDLLDEPGLEDKAIKVVSMLLNHLPRHYRYRVIFMQRPAAEIARSQARMIARRGTAGAGDDESAVAQQLQAHREETLRLLRGSPNVFEVLEVDFPALVADPETWTARVADFVGPERLPHRERMPGIVRRDLHRNKGDAPAASNETPAGNFGPDGRSN